MKRLTKFSLFLMLLVASVTVTKAQSAGEISYGLKIGAVYSDFTNSEYQGRYGWSAGAFVDYTLSPKLGFIVELNYVEQGARVSEGLSIDPNDDPYDTKDFKLCYLQVPFMFKYNVWKGFNLKAGIQAGYLVREKLVWKNDDNVLRPDINEVYPNEEFAKFDLSVPVALNYAVSQRISFEYRYNIGLRAVNNEYKNRWMELSMAFKF